MREDALSDEQERPKVEIKTATVGSRLREERLSRGIKRTEIAERLHITNHYVKALESNSFDKLPGAIFVKGYLKNYAELLDLNPIELIGLYEKAISQSDECAKAKMPAQKLKIRNKYFAALSVILFLVVFITLWLYEIIVGEDPPVGRPVETTFDGVQKFQFPKMPFSETNLAETDSGLLKKGKERSIHQDGDSAFQYGELHRVIDLNSRGADKLDIQFSDESWIEIMDAPKNKPFREVVTAGNTLQVRGDAPFYILVADATSARIQFNGAEIELRDKIRIDNSASLTLGM